MRYREKGELHPMFHDSARFALDYLRENYGMEGMSQVIRANAQEVHQSIREKILDGDLSELVSHWMYYLEREKAAYKITASPDEVIIEVPECPAYRVLRELNKPVSENLCICTRLTNEFWCENSPFESETQCLAEGSCRQIFRRKK